MEELHQIAKTYYQMAPPQLKSFVNNFFSTMDVQKNGFVTLPEFLAFMNQGYTPMANPQFFKLLAKEGASVLTKWDVVTLFYILHSGRPICGGCGEFVLNTFFTCSNCYHTDTPFSICASCFIKGNWVHPHFEFSDNFVLLACKRMEEMSKKKPKSTSTSKSKASTSVSTSQAIVLAGTSTAQKRNMWNALLKFSGTVVKGGARALSFMGGDTCNPM